MRLRRTLAGGTMLLGILWMQPGFRAEDSPASEKPACAQPLRRFEEELGIAGAPVAHVWGVEPSSIAQQAGFEAGDLIVALGGRSMREFVDFRDFLTELRLAAMQTQAEVDLLRPEPGGGLRPLRVRAILPRSSSPGSARYLGLQCSFDYVVLSVPEGSEAAKAGVRRGDMVTQVGGVDVRRLEGADALDLLVQGTRGDAQGSLGLRVSRWKRSDGGKWDEVEAREITLPIPPASP